MMAGGQDALTSRFVPPLGYLFLGCKTGGFGFFLPFFPWVGGWGRGWEVAHLPVLLWLSRRRSSFGALVMERQRLKSLGGRSHKWWLVCVCQCLYPSSVQAEVNDQRHSDIFLPFWSSCAPRGNLSSRLEKYRSSAPLSMQSLSISQTNY